MKNEIKIIMSFDREGIDHDCDGPLSNASVRVYLNDQVIGCIQKLTFEADCKEVLPKLSITFPDFESLKYDKTAYSNQNSGYTPPFLRDVLEYKRLLSNILNVEVKTDGVDTEEPVVPLKEVGTDGVIDLIPMQRRHK